MPSACDPVSPDLARGSSQVLAWGLKQISFCPCSEPPSVSSTEQQRDGDGTDKTSRGRKRAPAPLHYAESWDAGPGSSGLSLEVGDRWDALRRSISGSTEGLD